MFRIFHRHIWKHIAAENWKVSDPISGHSKGGYTLISQECIDCHHLRTVRIEGNHAKAINKQQVIDELSESFKK